MDDSSVRRLLVLSNGHGEDAIALRIIHALHQQLPSIEIVALPIVGNGDSYAHHHIPIAGPVKAMPSGGFVYMDGKQLARDVQGGLIQLTLAQIQTVRQWARAGGSILAVGDIVPLLFAWGSGAPYAFIGTAKSEYYLRDEQGVLPRASWFEQLESWSGSVYLPWERWLMQHSRCKAVFPRDTLTSKILQTWPIPVFDVGNPMMDDLTVENTAHASAIAHASQQAKLTLVLLPGSRVPEAHANWSLILQGVQSVIHHSGDRPSLFLGAIAPSLDRSPFDTLLHKHGWQPGWQPKATTGDANDSIPVTYFTQGIHTLMLVSCQFNACIHYAEGAIALAGTATEQVVGLGKPAFIIPGQGPQFTPAFAEAQSRLLGTSVIQVSEPRQIGQCVFELLSDSAQLHQIQQNGYRRMGKPGASDRIAQTLIQEFGWGRSPCI
ncbi:MAG: lipid-A-disaccharide synthase-related protein [Leptolyngbyaceae bacterium]|nr:lipid-A-disaccharide synthase-related protein [Leptolyngbyaceae bacterium]